MNGLGLKGEIKNLGSVRIFIETVCFHGSFKRNGLNFFT